MFVAAASVAKVVHVTFGKEGQGVVLCRGSVCAMEK